MYQPALYGGLVIGVLSALPFISAGNFCCCLWILSGGFFAAYIDSQTAPRNLTVGRGALVGEYSGTQLDSDHLLAASSGAQLNEGVTV